MAWHVASRLREAAEARLYRNYVTDSLKALAEMFASAHGGRLQMPRWLEYQEQLEEGGRPAPKERSAEEVIGSIKAGLAALAED